MHLKQLAQAEAGQGTRDGGAFLSQDHAAFPVNTACSSPNGNPPQAGRQGLGGDGTWDSAPCVQSRMGKAKQMTNCMWQARERDKKAVQAKHPNETRRTRGARGALGGRLLPVLTAGDCVKLCRRRGISPLTSLVAGCVCSSPPMSAVCGRKSRSSSQHRPPSVASPRVFPPETDEACMASR